MRSVWFIVNGEDCEIPISDEEVTLGWLVSCALKKSHNTSKRPRGWEARDLNGALLDQDRTAADHRFKDKERMFLNLQIGAGGEIEIVVPHRPWPGAVVHWAWDDPESTFY